MTTIRRRGRFKKRRLPVSDKFYTYIRERIDSTAAIAVDRHHLRRCLIEAVDNYMFKAKIPPAKTEPAAKLLFGLLRPEIDKAMARSRRCREAAERRRRLRKAELLCKFAPMNSETTLTLEELTSRLGSVIAAESSLRNVWVTAETSDVRRAMHCYLELIQKNPVTGEPVARMRATIWRSALGRIDADFSSATGSRLGNGMKVRVLVSVSYHPSYGLSLNITDIDAAYTMGDLMRLRLEILARLQREGVLELNRELPWPDVPSRIAVISAPGAAGYGDFIHQLYTNPRHLRFSTRLYPALMQGREAPASIIAALESIAADEEQWDGVVIIRGGGATSDLASFENYDLAANIAQFPLPVIIGIGHERDVTVLDYVANMRVKTPTAAAEWLIGRGVQALDRLDSLASDILHTASTMVSGAREQLSYISATLPHLPATALRNSSARLDRCAMNLTETVRSRLRPQISRLDMITERIPSLAVAAVERRKSRLDALGNLLDVLSPMATLKRGYSITRVDGRAITSADSITPGTTITTTLATGTLTSTID